VGFARKNKPNFFLNIQTTYLVWLLSEKIYEWKEIRKKSQIVAMKAAVIMNEGRWPILKK